MSGGVVPIAVAAAPAGLGAMVEGTKVGFRWQCKYYRTNFDAVLRLHRLEK